MQQANLSGEKNFSGKSIKINLPVILFNEDGIYYAFIPSFDLTGYGRTQDEANESLTVVLDEFLRYTINKNTFLLELKRLGWKITSKKKPMVAPQMSDLINTSEQLKEIVNYKKYTTSDLQVNMPSFS
ncbi:MAG: hypothetical protein H0X70_00780 [Segetibacter sp.]|jgi:predicted RNase H-like HicB family nuclease|nr:hypothetical protein [Segetibacter sp.]